MARINQRSVDTVSAGIRGAAHVNSHNSAAIIEAQNAYVACSCDTARCEHERKLWEEIERGEDMYIATIGAKP